MMYYNSISKSFFNFFQEETKGIKYTLGKVFKIIWVFQFICTYLIKFIFELQSNNHLRLYYCKTMAYYFFMSTHFHWSYDISKKHLDWPKYSQLFLLWYEVQKIKCLKRGLKVQGDLVICGLFICKFAYMRLRMILIYRTYPLIYSDPWSFYMWIRYMRVIFYGPYLSHITSLACTW